MTDERGGHVGSWALVEDSALRPSSDPACAGPPSPEGEGFGAGELGWVRRENRKARRLASPSGGGAQCAHWAERAFPPTTPYRTGRHPKAWIYRQGIRFALTAAARRPSSVSPAASHLPPRGKALVRGNLVGTVGNAPGRRGEAPALRKARRRASPSGGGAQCEHGAEWAFPVHHHVTNRVTPNGVGLPPGFQARNCQRRHAAPLRRLRRQLSQGESQVGAFGGRCPVRTLGGEGFPSPPPRNEPGDTQWWWSTARVAGSNCQRPLAAF